MHSISSATLENPYEYRWVYSQAVSVSLVQVLPTLKQQQGQGGEEHKKKDISFGTGESGRTQDYRLAFIGRGERLKALATPHFQDRIAVTRRWFALCVHLCLPVYMWRPEVDFKYLLYFSLLTYLYIHLFVLYYVKSMCMSVCRPTNFSACTGRPGEDVRCPPSLYLFL